MKWNPYVYFIRHRPTGLKYVGVRYAKGCDPSDFWVTYFTSSKLVNSLVNEYGKDSFQIKVWKVFPERLDLAIKMEASFFKFIAMRDDYLNITYSSGLQDARVASKGGKVGGAVVKSRGIGIFAISPDQQKKNAIKGGKVGGAKQRDLKMGIHAQTREERLLLSSKGGLAAVDQAGFKDPRRQAERGRRGGVKNQSSVWVNDGNHSFKFTSRMSELETLDDYLIRTGHVKGRLNCTSYSTCPHCGEHGVTMTIRRTHFGNCKQRKQDEN